MAWSAPRTWVTAEVVTAAHMNQEVRDNLNAGFPDAVTSNDWDPTLEGTTTNPSTSSVDGAEYQIGALQFCWARWVMGAVGGSGTFFVTLPSTAVNLLVNTAIAAGTPVGSWVGRDDSVPAGTGGPTLLRTTTAAHFQVADFPGGLVTESVPWTWSGAVSTDYLGFQAVYPFA